MNAHQAKQMTIEQGYEHLLARIKQAAQEGKTKIKVNTLLQEHHTLLSEAGYKVVWWSYDASYDVSWA